MVLLPIKLQTTSSYVTEPHRTKCKASSLSSAHRISRNNHLSCWFEVWNLGWFAKVSQHHRKQWKTWTNLHAQETQINSASHCQEKTASKCFVESPFVLWLLSTHASIYFTTEPRIDPQNLPSRLTMWSLWGSPSPSVGRRLRSTSDPPGTGPVWAMT